VLKRKKLLILGATLFGLSTIICAGNPEKINGSGASFPALIYRIWMYNYNKASGVEINYQSIGSEAGLSQLLGKTVDFGASDTPIAKSTLKENGLIQFPMLIGGVAVAVNIPGIKKEELKLTSELLVDIFLGEIKKWNDPRIVEINKDLKLPALPINVVHRSNGSGTTWVFTNYLSKTSDKWKKKVGCAKYLKWPTGIGARNNSGMANFIKRIVGAIGYLEFNYAIGADISYVKLKNRSGEFVEPSIKSFKAAGAEADWKTVAEDAIILTDQPGKNTWPITCLTYIIIYKNQTDPKTAIQMMKFFNWCYHSDVFPELHYVPIPENAVKEVEKLWLKKLSSDGKPLLKQFSL
jgi:phosphate transport system substrate-binding protein